MGLSVVKEAVKRLQGDVRMTPKCGAGTCVSISVPLSIATHRLLLAMCRGQVYGIPLHAIERLLRLKLGELETIEGQPTVRFGRNLVPLVSLAHLLEGDQSPGGDYEIEGDTVQVALLRAGTRRLSVVVDSVVAERDCLICGLDQPAAGVSCFAGGVVVEDGRVGLVIDPRELIARYRPSQRTPTFASIAREAEPRTSTILVVDDSFTTRTLEKTVLEAHGYEVRIAVDGAEALAQVTADPQGIDLVISDIQMPRLDGFGLLEEMKQNPRLASIPVILVTSLDAREHRERGVAAGADAYIVKSAFDQGELLCTIGRLL
jgi:two-component system chemotaxis sensor kinase CheA